MKKFFALAVVMLVSFSSLAIAAKHGSKSKSHDTKGESIKVQNHGEEYQIRQRTRAGNCTGMTNATMNGTMNATMNATMNGTMNMMKKNK